jgi:isopentenyldiphosphate isomerase
MHVTAVDTGGELVDVVDAEDRVVGRATRTDVRRANLRHRSVYVLVFNRGGELFVHRRTPTKDVYPGHLDVAIGGVPLAGEDYEAAARRELGEEIGVVDVSPERLFALRYADAVTTLNGVVFRCVHDGPFALQASEIESGEFLPLAEVVRRVRQEPFCPDGLAVLARYRESFVPGAAGGQTA